MLFPVGDEPNPHTASPATLALIAVNVIVFIATYVRFATVPADPSDPALQAYLALIARELPGQSAELLAKGVSAYDLLVFKYGFRPSEASALALITSMFLHAGWMHLLGNMLYLWIFGNNVENRLGAPRFVLWYVLTGLAAVALHGLISRRSGIPMVGASGAISGILGFYLVWFPRNQVRVFLLIFPFVRVVMIPAIWMLGAYLVLDNILPFLLTRGADGVAHGAHIGGFATGAAAALAMRKREGTAGT